MDEIWKDIEGYEERYQVSNHGRVKSKERHRKHWLGGSALYEERFLTPINTHGYRHVILYKDGKKRCITIHQLVARAFIKNESNYPDVNHKDLNPSNNHVDNLEWSHDRENCIHRVVNSNKYSSRFPGVSWQKNRNKWHSYVNINGKRVNLGSFQNEEEAYSAHYAASEKHGLLTKYHPVL